MAGRYTRESLERVRDAVDFAELVGARTELRRAGVRRLQGLCPFHEERTPSFGIDPVEKLYHCFGCGVGGDVFTFVMETEGLDFAGALEWLADRAGIELERDAEDPKDAARRQRRDRLLALLERTAAFYVRVLWESPDAAPAREYLGSRGLEEGALREFRVGFSPTGYDRVVAAGRSAGYSDEELLACGLARRRRDDRGAIDGFRGRIMFPLCDERGRVLGFGARALRPDDRPKYLNSSDNEVFHKGRQVYAADLARAPAARAGRVVLVEGYTDAIALRQAGVAEVVGSMGTALTEPQVDALRRLAPTVLFCQDPDAAGQEAVARAAATVRELNGRSSARGLDFRIVRLPPGEDPADVVLRDGAEALRELLDAAVPYARFEVERALAGPSGDRDDALRAAASAIAPLPPSVLRDDLIRLTAERLGLTADLVASTLDHPQPGAPARSPGGRDGSSRGRPGGRSGGPGGWDGGSSGRSGGGSGRWDGARGRGFAGRDGSGGRGGTRPGDSGGRGGGGGRAANGAGGWGDGGPIPGEGGDAHADADETGAHAALDRREQSERAYLAYCVALPEEGEAVLREADLDELFSAPATRRAAEYLRGRLRHPAGELPAGDEPLARLVAELVIRAGQLEATPAKLELEGLQLDLHRLDRRLAAARTGAQGDVHALATERQRVLDAIRHRLS